MRVGIITIAALAIVGCESVESVPHVDDEITLDMPNGFDPMPIPELSPLTAAKVELGERLFFDPILSRDETISCASCHEPELAFADPRRLSVGVDGRLGIRNSMSLVNVGYQKLLFWDGGALTLENQALAPIEDRNEMDSELLDVLEKVNGEPTYRAQFLETFGDTATVKTLTQALAAFQRTIRTGGSRFDRYLDGDASALTAAETRGKNLFDGKAECSACHEGRLLTNQAFENNGLTFANSDSGRARITLDPADFGHFRVPSLRNLALTAPYMHDGRFRTLEEVVVHYDLGGTGSDNQHESVRPLGLSADERSDLLAFLRSLEDEVVLSGVDGSVQTSTSRAIN